LEKAAIGRFFHARAVCSTPMTFLSASHGGDRNAFDTNSWSGSAPVAFNFAN